MFSKSMILSLLFILNLSTTLVIDNIGRSVQTGTSHRVKYLTKTARQFKAQRCGVQEIN